MINAAYEIERLILFARRQGFVEPIDEVFARNQLLDVFKLEEPFSGQVPQEEIDYPTEILDRLMDYAEEIGLYDKEIQAYRELLDTKVMGFLLPRASEVINKFRELSEKEGKVSATNYFYKQSQASNYIRTAQIAKNIAWNYENEYGELEITINLSKPEKDPKQIALERTLPQKQYPKCMLCVENIGYAGRVNFPARQTIRYAPVTIGGENWYMQYSPYVYYNEHCIVFSQEHRPMKISKTTFQSLLEFVQQLPHYMCGSNADLPIVGGSILSHDHFQGGRYTFPMHKAKIIKTLKHPEFKDISIGLLKWPLSVMRVSCDNIESLIEFSDFVLYKWREYSDEKVWVKAYTEDGSQKTPHNTITPIARMNEAGKYEMDLVLRNNRTSEEHPDGIFHPHKEIHHVKKENIGLIEVMGLAILPARLSVETKFIEEILTGTTDIDSIVSESHILFKHLDWIKELISKYGNQLSNDEASNIIKKEIGLKFKICLEHTGVFKQDEQGQLAFDRFLNSIRCEEIK